MVSLKELKKNRFTPAERWVLGVIDGVEPETNEYGNVEWYNKDGEWLFTQGFGYGELVVSFHSIWSVLERKFSLKHTEIQELINNVMYDYTDNGKLIIV